VWATGIPASQLNSKVLDVYTYGDVRDTLSLKYGCMRSQSLDIFESVMIAVSNIFGGGNDAETVVKSDWADGLEQFLKG
jgi:hypothetical protein